ncbi:MAG: hypothetical protein KF745_08340 [Phycisphaeraceae bacterium]|nr:hypothetical protein [Phycisphaeraceae bacterium]
MPPRAAMVVAVLALSLTGSCAYSPDSFSGPGELAVERSPGGERYVATLTPLETSREGESQWALSGMPGAFFELQLGVEDGSVPALVGGELLFKAWVEEAKGGGRVFEATQGAATMQPIEAPTDRGVAPIWMRFDGAAGLLAKGDAYVLVIAVVHPTEVPVVVTPRLVSVPEPPGAWIWGSLHDGEEAPPAEGAGGGE